MNAYDYLNKRPRIALCLLFLVLGILGANFFFAPYSPYVLKSRIDALEKLVKSK